MSDTTLSYALVSAVRDEENNLSRLAACIAEQTVKPLEWIIVDTGSTDGTQQLASELAESLGFVRVMSIDGVKRSDKRGVIAAEVGLRIAMDARGFVAGIKALERTPDVVIKVDADLSFETDFFERILEAFAGDPQLGITSGLCTELEDGEWRAQHGTRSHVWGASRAYRWACFQDVSPLEDREGWDEIDAVKAKLHGWRVGALLDLPFRHHRAWGRRAGSARTRWEAQGDTAHYMGYRFSYLLARAVWRARKDPAALAMISGYARAATSRQPQCPDPDVRGHLRAEQRARRLPLRVRESLGHAA